MTTKFKNLFGQFKIPYDKRYGFLNSNALIDGTDDFFGTNFFETLNQITIKTSPALIPLVKVDSIEGYIFENNCLKVSVPGFSRDQLLIEIDKHILKISSRDGVENGFCQPFKIDFDISKFDLAAISAHHENGILSISLKPLPSAKKEDKREIEIK